MGSPRLSVITWRPSLTASASSARHARTQSRAVAPSLTSMPVALTYTRSVRVMRGSLTGRAARLRRPLHESRVGGRLHRLRRGTKLSDERVEVRPVQRFTRADGAVEIESAASGQHEVIDDDGVAPCRIERTTIRQTDRHD